MTTNNCYTLSVDRLRRDAGRQSAVNSSLSLSLPLSLSIYIYIHTLCVYINIYIYIYIYICRYIYIYIRVFIEREREPSSSSAPEADLRETERNYVRRTGRASPASGVCKKVRPTTKRRLRSVSPQNIGQRAWSDVFAGLNGKPRSHGWVHVPRVHP